MHGVCYQKSQILLSLTFLSFLLPLRVNRPLTFKCSEGGETEQ
jgi:hypothetical protein